MFALDNLPRTNVFEWIHFLQNLRKGQHHFKNRNFHDVATQNSWYYEFHLIKIADVVYRPKKSISKRNGSKLMIETLDLLSIEVSIQRGSASPRLHFISSIESSQHNFLVGVILKRDFLGKNFCTNKKISSSRQAINMGRAHIHTHTPYCSNFNFIQLSFLFITHLETDCLAKSRSRWPPRRFVDSSHVEWPKQGR